MILLFQEMFRQTYAAEMDLSPPGKHTSHLMLPATCQKLFYLQSALYKDLSLSINDASRIRENVRSHCLGKTMANLFLLGI